MAKLILYKDAELTQIACTIPIGIATGHTNRAGTPGFNPEQLPLHPEIKFVNATTQTGNIHYFTMTGITCDAVVPDIPDNTNTTLYFDGGTVTVKYRQSTTLTNYVSVYLIGNRLYGSGQANGGLSAVHYTYNGEQYIVLLCGSYNNGSTTSPCCAFTVNAIGKKSYKKNYDDESKPLNDSGGNSWGGSGDNDRTSDNVGASPHITGVAPFNLTAGRGQHVYILDGASFDTFTGYLWGTSQSIFGDLWQKWQNLKFNPIGAILGCHCLPTAFTPLGTDVSSIYLAGTPLSPMPSAPAICQAVTPDNGHIIQYPADGSPSYLDVSALIDFTDFTGVSITIHVPFCGSCTVPASACVGGVGMDGNYHAGGIGVVFRCDILTGNVCAFIMCRDRNGREQCLQTLTGNCAYQIPITGNDNGTGQMLGAIVSTAVGAVMGNAGAVVSGIVDAAAAAHNTNIVGNHGGSAAVLTNLYCYAEFTYNEYSRPAETDPTRGRPSDLGGTVGESNGVQYAGFTVFDSVDVHAVNATTDEKAEIESLLTSGVYL